MSKNVCTYEEVLQFSLNWLICSAAFILSDWILSIWESGTVGRIGLHAGGGDGMGIWCFIDVIEWDIISSRPLGTPQDATLALIHDGLNIKYLSFNS